MFSNTQVRSSMYMNNITSSVSVSCLNSFVYEHAGVCVVVFICFEPVHEISNNVVCATSKATDQPAHTRSLIRAFASRLSIL